MARADFYRDIPFLAGRLPRGYGARAYPASTGIGTAGRGITVSAIALATEREDIVAVPLENPRQTAGLRLFPPVRPREPEVFAGHGPLLRHVRHDLRFRHGEHHQLGDASRGRRGRPNPRNPGQHGRPDLRGESRAGTACPGLGTSLEGLGLVRVYLKRQADYAHTRAVCQERLGELPTIYAVADVCRPELLVEIEGIAFSRRAPRDVELLRQVSK